MKKEIITSKQAIAILFLTLVGSTAIVGFKTTAKQDSWMSLILGCLGALPILLIYARIIRLYPGLDIFDIVQKLFGKIVGKIFIILITWYGFHLGALVICNFGQFIHTSALTDTPSIPIYLLMGLMAIYAVKSGVETYGKSALIFTPILILTVAFTAISSFKDFDFSNLQPILHNNWRSVSESAFSAMTFPFAEIVLFLVIADSVKPKDNPYKIFSLGLLYGGILLIIALLRNILILGFPLLNDYFFPSFSTARVIIIGKGNALARFEQLVTGNFMVGGYVKTSLCLFASSKGIAKLFGIKDYRRIVFPIGLTMVAIALTLYRNVMEMFDWLDVYKYYALPFQILIPVIIWITAELKSRKKKTAPPISQAS